ncbi:MAG: FAD-binding protein [Candidatus Lindowbacteria bacterium]|nr:FAD-binding protein [Candidatus Lindowbacteria bacterium]
MRTIKSDVLVIGSGGAGVTAAVEAAQQGARVAIVSKEPVGYGDTRISLGVMSTAPDTSVGDSEEQFAEDMMRGGEGLNDARLVGALVHDALEATVTFESFGHIFSRDDEGKLKILTVPPGGHSVSRAISSPAVGISIGHTMRAAAARSQIEVIEEAVCSELLVHDGAAVGAVAFLTVSGEPVILLAKSTIIAAGGAGSLYYPHTDCMPSVIGDSFGLALDAGAELVDMEQVQFIPFAITHPRSMLGAPCGEPAMAGPYGKLFNNKGELVLENIMPMTRAAVSRAMIEEIRRGGATEHGGLILDLRPNVESPGGELFVALMKKLGGAFLDIIRKAYGEKAANLEAPWDVLPSAHYNMGGIKTDEWCRSCVPGLYACGQAQGGVMGGNRLGSTSLTEVFVFGKRAGKTAAREASARPVADAATAAQSLEKLQSLAGSSGASRPIELKRALQRLMWEKVGPLRDGDGLEQALEEIRRLRNQARDLRVSQMKNYNTEVVDAIELSHMLPSAEAIVVSALERAESRGAHVRSDFPERDDKRPITNVIVKLKNSECQARCAEKDS